MKVKSDSVKFKVNPEIKDLILQKYKTVRRFSEKVGYTESMISHVLHGRKMIYSWLKDDFVLFLGISMYDERKYFEVCYDSKVS